MSVPTSPPPISKPRFGLLHVMQKSATEGGQNGVFVGGALDTTQNPRCYDNLAGRVSQLIAPSVLDYGWALIRFPASGNVFRDGVTLLGILGNNFSRTESILHIANGGILHLYVDAGNSPIYEMAMPGNAHWIDGIVDNDPSNDANYANNISVLVAENDNTEPVSIGEFVATRMLEPANGISHSWIWDINENLLISTTEASASYTVVRGPERRLFAIETNRIPADEMGLWKQIVAKAAAGEPFVYSPPENGQLFAPIVITDDTADWTGIGGTNTITITADGHDPENQDAVTISPLTFGSQHGLRTNSSVIGGAGGSEDWTGKWLRFDIRFADWTWLAFPKQFFVRVWEGPFANATDYDLSDVFLGTNPLVDTWYRCYIDLENHTPLSAEFSRGVDLSIVEAMEFKWVPTDTGDVMSLCNIGLVDPNKLPAWVEATGHSIEQDSDSPLADPTYTVKLDMVEVVT